jgi:penicillin amidase
MKQAACELGTDDAEIRQALELFNQFDGEIRVDSPGAALYEVWVRQAIAVMLEGRLCGLEERTRGKGPSGMWSFHAMEWLAYHLEENESPWWQGANRKGRNEILLEGLRRAVHYLKQRLGPDMRSWQWGALHQITFDHTLSAQPLLEPLFSPGPFPLRGDNNTVCASGGRMADVERAQIGGAPFRFTIDMADPDHAQVAFAPGQSGRPGDRHYADGIDDWLAGRYHTLLYKREEIEQAAEGRLKLTGAP